MPFVASSKTNSCFTYDVFLSFRGADTRLDFTDHLYSALKQVGLTTFRDDDELGKGKDIRADLHKAIRESQISIVILSKDYASSTWCLDELVRILERVRSGSHMVLPIFYDVTTSDVKRQTGSFSSSFIKHNKEAVKNNKLHFKIKRWRAALKFVAGLSGMELKNRYRAPFIREIVKEIRDKLHPGKLDLTPYLVGVNSTVKKINSWLQDEAHDKSMSIIYGMGGIGKTTIAKDLYNKNFERFESSSFIADVKGRSKDYNGLICLQNQLIFDIVKGKIHEVHNLDDGTAKIKKAICQKKLLIIFDDVDKWDEFEALLGKQNVQLGQGSKIILTTRNGGLQRAIEVCKMFHINGLNKSDSLQLFSWHAFGKNHPDEIYRGCSTKVVKWCEGFPLALEVLGSSLSGRSNIDMCINETLEKLKRSPNDKIQQVLRISYDSLADDDNQNLFLHIACFFVGMENNYVCEILKGCGFQTLVGIQTLVDRCLLSINRDNMIQMHQRLVEMGRHIVFQESKHIPGERSRLWNSKDAFRALRDGKGTDKVRGLVFDLSRLVKSSYGYEEVKFEDDFLTQQQIPSSPLSPSSKGEDLHTESFRMMHELQILQLYGNVEGDSKYLPKNLVMLCWHEFPSRCIPENFHLRKLVSLDLSYSEIKSVWDGTMVLLELKFLNLSYCHLLSRMPNFHQFPCLQRLIFRGCINIHEVDESIICLKKLLRLNLKDCTSLGRLPKNFTTLESLEELDLSGCSNLCVSPEELREMKSMKVFHASNENMKIRILKTMKVIPASNENMKTETLRKMKSMEVIPASNENMKARIPKNMVHILRNFIVLGCLITLCLIVLKQKGGSLYYKHTSFPLYEKLRPKDIFFTYVKNYFPIEAKVSDHQSYALWTYNSQRF